MLADSIMISVHGWLVHQKFQVPEMNTDPDFQLFWGLAIPLGEDSSHF